MAAAALVAVPVAPVHAASVVAPAATKAPPPSTVTIPTPPDAAPEADAAPEGDVATEGEAPSTEEGDPDAVASPEDTEGEPVEEVPPEDETAASAEAAAADESASEPPPPEEADPWAGRPDEPRIAGKPRTGKGLLIAGGATAGVGLVATIVFSVITLGCSVDGPTQCRYRNQDTVLIPIGIATLAIGGMLLAVGGGYYVQYKKWQNWKPGQLEEPRPKRVRGRRTAVVAPGWIPGGATLGYAVRF